MKLQLVTAKTANSVTDAEAKTHLHITHSDEDTYIGTLVDAAQEFCENFTNRKYEAETWKMHLDTFPKEIELPFAPVSAITHIKYYDADNEQQTFSSDDYEYSLNSEPVVIRADDSWPGVYDRYEAIEIQFVCGVTSPAVTPLSFKQAMLLLIGDMYANREDNVRRFPNSVSRLLFPLKLH